MSTLISEEAKEIGRKSEARFFEVIESSEIMPFWYRGVAKASLRQDVCGVDAIATITRRGTKDEVLVPIQIKCSAKHVGIFFANRPVYWLERIVTVVCHPDMRKRAIEHQLRIGLQHVYSHGYDYTEFFRLLEEEYVSSWALAQVENQTQRRAA